MSKKILLIRDASHQEKRLDFWGFYDFLKIPQSNQEILDLTGFIQERYKVEHIDLWQCSPMIRTRQTLAKLRSHLTGNIYPDWRDHQ